MKLGIAFHATDLSMSAVDLAREAEVRGFYSVYLPEHTHIPTSRRTPAPTGDAVLGEEYNYDPSEPYFNIILSCSHFLYAGEIPFGFRARFSSKFTLA